LRFRLALSHAVFALGLVVLATIIAERSADTDRREAAVTAARHDAESLATQLSPAWSDDAQRRALVQLESSYRRSAAALDATRRVVAQTDPDPSATIGTPRWEGTLDAALNADSAEAINGRWVLAMAPVIVDQDVVGAAAVVERTPAITPWRGPLRLALGFGSALVALAAFGGWLLADRISRPLRRLTAATSELALGRRPSAVPTSTVTEVFTLNAAVDRVAQRLEQLERLARERDEADRQALRRLAHAIRTPLAVMALRIDDLDDPNLTDEERRELHEMLSRQFEALEDTAAGLAGLAQRRPDATDEVIDVRAILLSAVAQIGPLARWSGQRLDADGDNEPVLVHGRQDAVRDAVGNLLENAVKYTPRGGRIRANLSTGDGLVILTVEDSGPGIPEAERTLVVQAGVRGTSATGTSGTGLGLSLVAATATQLGGRLELDRSPLGGLAARFVLPGNPAGAEGVPRRPSATK
jgi:signal transduction histidine kinase